MFARTVSIHLKPNNATEFTQLIEKEALRYSRDAYPAVLRTLGKWLRELLRYAPMRFRPPARSALESRLEADRSFVERAGPVRLFLVRQKGTYIQREMRVPNPGR